MSKWFFFGTNRGDIVALVEEEDVQTAEDFQNICESKKTLLVKYPVSPKATARLIAVCQLENCGYIEVIDQKTAQIMVNNQGGNCNKCSQKSAMPMPDETNVHIEYRSLGSLFETENLSLTLSAVTYACPVKDQDEMEQVKEQIYFSEPEAEAESSSNIIRLP